MKKFYNHFRERVNLMIGGILASLGVGATGCDLMTDFRTVDVSGSSDKPIVNDTDVVVCKYGVPAPDPIEEPEPSKPDTIIDEPPVCMYGVPSAAFQIKGSVSDRRTGRALERIQVYINTRSNEFLVETDKDGHYELKTDWIFPSDSVFVTFTDQENKYEEKMVGEKMEYEGGKDAWNMGEAKVVVDAQLDKKSKSQKKKK